MLDVNILKDAISQLSADGKILIRRTANHKELLNQLTSEVPRFKEGTFSKNLWQLRPARQNHLLDCLVYAFAAALIEQGKTLDGAKTQPKRKAIIKIGDSK
jgi:phage terminase large subunit GpA-like protein